MIFNATCIGKDGKERNYKFHVMEEQTKIRVNITNFDESPKLGAIDFQFLHLDDGTLRISDMYIDIEEYRQKGIPEGIIINLSRLLQKTILSSTKFQNNGEHLHEDAIKVWKRLVSQDLAVFDSSLERYKTLTTDEGLI